jgi:alanine racemase
VAFSHPLMNRREHDSAFLHREAGAALTVRLAPLRANYRKVLARAGVPAAPVVKADAYGLGLLPIARALLEAGADTFFVARLDEGIELRATARNERIFVLDGLRPGTSAAMQAHALTPVLNSAEEIAEWSRFAVSRKTTLPAAIQIDTGLNRSGLSREDLASIVAAPRDKLRHIEVVLLMSHLACADEPSHPMNRAQLERFRAALAMLPPAPASLAASDGIELGAAYRFDMVRPGLALYGGHGVLGAANPYAGVASLTAPILQLRRIAKGETVGYGAAFAASRDSTIAIAAAGYADGLMRSLGTKGRAVIGGAFVPFAGRVSMDLVCLDVTDADARSLFPGAEIEFLGESMPLAEVAAASGTVAHEVLIAVNRRARRVYMES